MMRKSEVDYEEFDQEDYIATPGVGTPDTSFETMPDEPSPSRDSGSDSERTETASELSFYESLRMSPESLLPDGDGAHSLLDESTPPYSNMTVRRAFIVWAHGGQANEFKEVCNYYHRLEALEKTMTPEHRLQSRLPEFDLLSSGPPKSQFQMTYFPNLFGPNRTYSYNNGEMSFEDRVFTLEGFLDLKVHNGVSTKDILTTSEIIRRYCKEHRQSLKGLLCQYQAYNKKCGLKNSLSNLSIYIKKLFLKDELELYHNIRNMPTQFSFLDNDTGEVHFKRFARAIERPSAVKPPKKTIINPDNRKPNVCQTLLSSLPQLPADKLVCTPNTHRSAFTVHPQSSNVFKPSPYGKLWCPQGTQSSSGFMPNPQNSSVLPKNSHTTIWGTILPSASSSGFIPTTQSESIFAPNPQGTWCSQSSNGCVPISQSTSVLSPNCQGTLWGPQSTQSSTMFDPSPQRPCPFICTPGAQSSYGCSPSPQRSLLTSPSIPCTSNSPQSLSYSPQPLPSCNPPLSAYSPQFRAFMAKFMKGEIQSM